MKGRKTGRGRKKALTLLLIFISSTLEFLARKKRPLRARVELNHDFIELLGLL